MAEDDPTAHAALMALSADPFDMQSAIRHFADGHLRSDRFDGGELDVVLTHFFGEIPEMLLPSVTIIESLVSIAFGDAPPSLSSKLYEAQRAEFVALTLEFFGALATRAAQTASVRADRSR